MNSVSFKSPRDGSILTFTVLKRDRNETDFEIAVATPQFSGKSSVSTYSAGSPAAMFTGMAAEWKGWKGEKSWGDLEDRGILSATCDSTGHVSMKVVLNGINYDSNLSVTLIYESGQLDRMAQEIRRLFGA